MLNKKAGGIKTEEKGVEIREKDEAGQGSEL